MPVATVPSYDEMWVDPQVVAALSNGVFTYVDAQPWVQANAYPRCASVLYGDGPYGGWVYTAAFDVPAGSAAPDVATDLWVLDTEATNSRLALYTATLQATWLLDTLTGYRLHGEECWQEDYQVHTCTIRLRRGPVVDIDSVVRISRCNVPGAEVPDWCRKSTSTISLCCGGCTYAQFTCGCDDNVVRVTYKIGSNLPPGTEAVTAWLATEYGKAAAGAACSLPERVTNITRQGVSWTVLDPQDFLEAGRTGMSRVDTWLAPVKASLGGQLIDPLTSTRLFAQRLDCDVAPVPA